MELSITLIDVEQIKYKRLERYRSKHSLKEKGMKRCVRDVKSLDINACANAVDLDRGIAIAPHPVSFLGTVDKVLIEAICQTIPLQLIVQCRVSRK